MKNIKKIDLVERIKEIADRKVEEILCKNYFYFTIFETWVLESFLGEIEDAVFVKLKEKEVKYNWDEKTIHVKLGFHDWKDNDIYKEIVLDYNILTIKKEYENKHGVIREIVIMPDGRIRYIGKLQCYIKITGLFSEPTQLYDNIYESNTNNSFVFYQGNMVNGLPEGEGKLVWSDETLLYEGEFKEGKITGYGKTYFLNGNISSEGNRIEGMENGEVIDYYENGQVLYQGKKRDGIDYGYGISYYPDGRLMHKGETGEDGVVKDGVMYYLDNGVIYKVKGNKEYLVNPDGSIIRKLSKKEFKELKSKYKNRDFAY